eukprot:4556006-Heterocapsa_arctica.AAC.1
MSIRSLTDVLDDFLRRRLVGPDDDAAGPARVRSHIDAVGQKSPSSLFVVILEFDGGRHGLFAMLVVADEAQHSAGGVATDPAPEVMFNRVRTLATAQGAGRIALEPTCRGPTVPRQAPHGSCHPRRDDLAQ